MGDAASPVVKGLTKGMTATARGRQEAREGSSDESQAESEYFSDSSEGAEMDEAQEASYAAAADAVAAAAGHKMDVAKPPQRDGLAAAAEAPQGMPFNIHYFEETTLFVFVDVEVFNPNRANGDLISLGACFAWREPNSPLRTLFAPLPDTFYELIKPLPECEPNKYCTAVHNITRDMVKDAQPYEVVRQQLNTEIEKRATAVGASAIALVAHNGDKFFYALAA
jgi:hypothetical protein